MDRSRAAPGLIRALEPVRRPATVAYTAKVLALALAYFGAAKAGLALAYENSSVTAVWPPTGIALAALVLWGRRLWPGVALGALLANSWTGVPLVTVLGITAGNTLEALVGATLLTSVAHFRPSLDRARDVLALALLAAALSTMVSATVGVVSLHIGDAVSEDALASTWRTWWLGDVGGDLIVAPLLMVLARGHRPRVGRRPWRLLEAVALLVVLPTVSWIVFSTPGARAFMIFPVVIWATLRFGQRGVVVGSLIVAGIATGFTASGVGPLAQGSPDTSLLLSQAFVGILTMVSLLLAAITAEREQAQTALEKAYAGLAETVRKRTAQLRRSQAWLEEAQQIAQLGSWDWDIQADRVTWSHELYRIFGVGLDDYEPSYAGYIGRVHPDDRVRVEATIRGAFADHQPFAFDQRIVRPDGSVRTLATRAEVFVDGDGQPVRLLGVCQDVTERHRVQEALREAEERARRVVQDAHEAFVSIDARGAITDWNPQAEILFGWSRAEAVGRNLGETIIPERYRAAHRRGLERFVATGEGRVLGKRLELEALHRDGHEFPIELSVSALRTQDGYVFNALLHDISERKRAERVIQEAEERFRGTFEEAPIGMALIDLQGRFQHVNRALSGIVGYSREELEAASLESLAHPDDMEEIRSHMTLLATGEASSYTAEKRYIHASGHPIWVALQVTLLRDGNGQPTHSLAQLLDITDRRRYEEKLRELADHDPLTGLLNRRSFEREMESHLERGRRYGMEGAALVLDLDHFKYVNDSLGHNAGDELIVRVAHALDARLRETDLLARLGGDEFAVLLPKADAEAAHRVASDLVATVRKQGVHSPDGGSSTMTASAGIALIDEQDGLTGEDVMANADLAMYDAKEQGRDRIALYGSDDRSHTRMKGRMTWLERIRGALEEDRFTLLAQPIIDLSTGRASQYELLLRMRDETGDLIPPAAFLYVAEGLDVVQEIDRWVVRNAIAILEEQERLGRALTFEVNLSGRSLGDPELFELIVAELERSQMPGERLIFEVTETAAVADMSAASSFSERLAELGCRFALDDFGAGFGSFYYLKHLPFDFLKIDGEFVRNCCASQTDRLLIRAVVDIARGLEKKTVAEIVGDDETVALLAELGVHYGQGYHLGRPAPLEEAFAEAPLAVVAQRG
jgi:diguanylate cyclase (GGDEF)-like protein/PAS domain S-box-containing protein